MGRFLETFDGPPSRKRRFIRNLAMVTWFPISVGILAWKLCVVASPTAIPVLTKQWHEQVYSLDEGETVRFVPPPYDPERMQDTMLRRDKQLGFVVYGNAQISSIWREDRKPYPEF